MPAQNAERAGSRAGSTRCSTCRGPSAPRTADSTRPAPCSTPTTPGSTRSRTGSSSCSPSASCGPSGARRGGRRARRKPGAILALVGPPGVGKTSLGESVARALGRVRPGRPRRRPRRGRDPRPPPHLRRRAARPHRAGDHRGGPMNPVVLLDEVDKVGSDWRGDPSSALLEVLDPAQNHTFRDHYLEVDLDLSDVLFLATANVLETIPGPLLDRMEVVRLDGYTEDEKVAIAATTCSPARSGPGLRDDEVVVTDAALPGSSPATPARPASASSSGSSARPAQGGRGSPAARRRRSRRRRRRRPTCSDGRASRRRVPSASPSPASPPASPSPAPAATCCSSRPPPMDGEPGLRSPASSAT